MDPQIGTDIAKLLGSLSKSTVSSGSLASGSEAGAAFKRALVAIIIFKEKFQLFHFTGTIFILSGIYLSNRKLND